MFPGGNIKISNVLKISPRLRAVPLGLRHQGSVLLLLFSVFFFIEAEWLGLGPKSYRRIFASHSSISSAKVGQPTCNNNNNISICLRFSMIRQWRSGKIVRYCPEGRRFESGWATIDLFPQCFYSSYKNSVSTFKSSSQVPHQSSRTNRGVAHPGLCPSLPPPPPPPPIEAKRNDCFI